MRCIQSSRFNTPARGARPPIGPKLVRNCRTAVPHRFLLILIIIVALWICFRLRPSRTLHIARLLTSWTTRINRYDVQPTLDTWDKCTCWFQDTQEEYSAVWRYLKFILKRIKLIGMFKKHHKTVKNIKIGKSAKKFLEKIILLIFNFISQKNYFHRIKAVSIFESINQLQEKFRFCFFLEVIFNDLEKFRKIRKN